MTSSPIGVCRSFFDTSTNDAALSNRTRTFVHTLVNLRLDQPFDGAGHESAIRAESYMRIMFKLTAEPDYRAVAGGECASAARKHPASRACRAVATYRFRRTLTDLGMCDTFNSRIAPYLSAEFYVSGEPSGAIDDPPMETNSFDAARRSVEVHAVHDSQVNTRYCRVR